MIMFQIVAKTRVNHGHGDSEDVFVIVSTSVWSSTPYPLFTSRAAAMQRLKDDGRTQYEVIELQVAE